MREAFYPDSLSYKVLLRLKKFLAAHRGTSVSVDWLVEWIYALEVELPRPLDNDDVQSMQSRRKSIQR